MWHLRATRQCVTGAIVLCNLGGSGFDWVARKLVPAQKRLTAKIEGRSAQ